MSATNQTSNYELPLFIGTDKPSWLGDFNGAMNAIDTAIKGRADDISSLGTRMTATETVANTASSNASTALTNASNANTAAIAAQGTADTANTAAAAAQSTANTALSNAATAQSTADTASATATSAMTLGNTNAAEIAKLNLTEFNTITNSNITTTYGTVDSTETRVQTATNTQGTVGKIFGRLVINNPGNSNRCTVTIPTAFRPSEEITINGCALLCRYTSTGIEGVVTASMTIATNGTITLNLYNQANYTQFVISFMACLLFMADFGDTPID